MNKPSIYTRADEWAELGLVKDLAWFTSFPDNYGRRQRRGYLTLVGVNRDNRGDFKRLIEECREFKAWFSQSMESDAWSFDMHDVPRLGATPGDQFNAELWGNQRFEVIRREDGR